MCMVTVILFQNLEVKKFMYDARPLDGTDMCFSLINDSMSSILYKNDKKRTSHRSQLYGSISGWVSAKLIAEV